MGENTRLAARLLSFSCGQLSLDRTNSDAQSLRDICLLRIVVFRKIRQNLCGQDVVFRCRVALLFQCHALRGELSLLVACRIRCRFMALCDRMVLSLLVACRVGLGEQRTLCMVVCLWEHALLGVVSLRVFGSRVGSRLR